MNNRFLSVQYSLQMRTVFCVFPPLYLWASPLLWPHISVKFLFVSNLVHPGFFFFFFNEAGIQQILQIHIHIQLLCFDVTKYNTQVKHLSLYHYRNCNKIATSLFRNWSLFSYCSTLVWLSERELWMHEVC